VLEERDPATVDDKVQGEKDGVTTWLESLTGQKDEIQTVLENKSKTKGKPKGIQEVND
jgi:hypothetical protein